MAANSPIGKKELVAYGMLAMPLAFAGIPLYLHAPDFYATEFGISLASLGFVLLALRCIDAIQDPLIGYWSDQYCKHRPRIMLVAAVILAASFALLFNPFVYSYLLWFAVCVLIATTAFSVLTINLNTLGGIWRQDKNEKTTIAGYREAFGLLGLILAVILPSVLQNEMSKAEAFGQLSFLLAVILFPCAVVFLWWQKKYSFLNQPRPVQPFARQSFHTLSRHSKHFFVVYGVSMLASSIPAVLVLFFIRDKLNLENYTGLFLLVYFLSAAVGIPIWQQLSKKVGKYKTWLSAMALAIVSFIWAYFLGEGALAQYLIICLMSGIAFGAELVLPASILADHIHAQQKQEHAAFHYGILAFLAKLALALAAALSFLFLEGAEFTPAAQNTEHSLQALSISYAAIPCLIKLISIYLLSRIINDKTIQITHTINRSSHNA